MLSSLSGWTEQIKRINLLLHHKKLVVAPAGKVIQVINCANWNVRSLNNKINQVMNFLVDNNIIILFVTETWLTDQNNNTTAQIKDHGYKIHHSHRSSRPGGGTALIYKNTVQLTKVFISDSPTFEASVANFLVLSHNPFSFFNMFIYALHIPS